MGGFYFLSYQQLINILIGTLEVEQKMYGCIILESGLKKNNELYKNQNFEGKNKEWGRKLSCAKQTDKTWFFTKILGFECSSNLQPLLPTLILKLDSTYGR